MVLWALVCAVGHARGLPCGYGQLGTLGHVAEALLGAGMLAVAAPKSYRYWSELHKKMRGDSATTR